MIRIARLPGVAHQHARLRASSAELSAYKRTCRWIELDPKCGQYWSDIVTSAHPTARHLAGALRSSIRRAANARGIDEHLIKVRSKATADNRIVCIAYVVTHGHAAVLAFVTVEAS